MNTKKAFIQHRVFALMQGPHKALCLLTMLADLSPASDLQAKAGWESLKTWHYQATSPFKEPPQARQPHQHATFIFSSFSDSHEGLEGAS